MNRNRALIRLGIVYTIYVVFLAQLQVTLPAQVAVAGQKPDLTLVLVILCGYLFGRTDGALIGLAAGFMRDMLAGRALGLGMLLLMYIGLLAALVFQNAFRRNLLLSLVQVIWLTILYELVITGVVYLVPMLPDVVYDARLLYTQMLQQLPARLLANAAAALPIALALYYMGPYKRQNDLDQDESARSVTV